MLSQTRAQGRLGRDWIGPHGQSRCLYMEGDRVLSPSGLQAEAVAGGALLVQGVGRDREGSTVPGHPWSSLLCPKNRAWLCQCLTATYLALVPGHITCPHIFAFSVARWVQLEGVPPLDRSLSCPRASGRRLGSQQQLRYSLCLQLGELEEKTCSAAGPLGLPAAFKLLPVPTSKLWGPFNHVLTMYPALRAFSSPP